MDEQGIMIEILKQLQKKYGCMNRIFTLTNDMREALSRDDRVSAQMLISMRQDEMDMAEECNRDLYALKSTLPAQLKQNVNNWINGEKPLPADGLEAVKMGEIASGIAAVLKKTIAVDKTMSTRIAGKDSFY